LTIIMPPWSKGEKVKGEGQRAIPCCNGAADNLIGGMPEEGGKKKGENATSKSRGGGRV